VRNVDLAARIRQAGGRSVVDASLLGDLPQEQRAGQSVDVTFDMQ